MSGRSYESKIIDLAQELIAEPRISVIYPAEFNSAHLIRTKGFFLPFDAPGTKEEVLEDIGREVADRLEDASDTWEVKTVDALPRGDARRTFVAKPHALSIVLRPNFHSLTKKD